MTFPVKYGVIVLSMLFLIYFLIFMLRTGKISRWLSPTLPNNYGRNMHRTLSYSYISKKQLDKIEKEHGDSWKEKFKMYSNQGKLIYKQGWQALKQDWKTYRSLRLKEKEGNIPLTVAETKLKKRMWQEIQGLKNLFIIQILPFSGPLLIYYIYVYPTSIPSWFSVDSIHEKYQLQCIETQAKAVEHFKKHPLNTQNFKLSHLKMEQLKKLSQLLFGHFEDGLTGYNKFAKIKKQYLFHPRFSKYLVASNIKKQFNKQKYENPTLKEKHIDQLVIQKYHRIISGQERIIFEPILAENSQQKNDEKQRGKGNNKNSK